MKFRITSEFGALERVRNGRPHTGIDYAMPEGTPINAVGDGVIKKVIDYGDTNAGKAVVMQLDDGKTVIYGHLRNFKAVEGQQISKGDVIAYSGNTGHSTGPHLHFAVKENGEYIDPIVYDDAIQSMGDEEKLNIFQKAINRVMENGKVDAYDPVSFVETVINRMFDSAGLALKNGMINAYEAMYSVLPEIGAVITLGAGVAIMLTGNVTRYGIIWGFSLLGVVLWLIHG